MLARQSVLGRDFVVKSRSSRASAVKQGHALLPCHLRLHPLRRERRRKCSLLGIVVGFAREFERAFFLMVSRYCPILIGRGRSRTRPVRGDGASMSCQKGLPLLSFGAGAAPAQRRDRFLRYSYSCGANSQLPCAPCSFCPPAGEALRAGADEGAEQRGSAATSSDG